jgi:hypothetical protein
VERCLVIVSRDQPELFERLASIYAQEGWIEVLLDRRHGQLRTGIGNRPDRRSPPSPDTDLQNQGFIVIPRREIVGPSP